MSDDLWQMRQKAGQYQEQSFKPKALPFNFLTLTIQLRKITLDLNIAAY